MYVGGISGVIGAFLYEQAAAGSMNGFLAIMIPLLSSLFGSLIMGLIYCFLTVTLRANQNVTGLALTTFGVGFGNFFGGSLIKLTGSEVPSISLSATSSYYSRALPFADKLGWFGKIFLSYGFLAYLAVIIAVIAAYVLKRTRIGLQLRAVGESPNTADAAGINVNKYKYVATCVGSMIAGLGGLVERCVRRPRLARHRAGHLHDLASERRHHLLVPVRRPVYPVHLHPQRHEFRNKRAV